MADVNVKATYSLTLSAAEFRLVSAALLAAAGVRPFRPEWMADAKELQERLFAARAASAQQWAEEVLRQTPAAPTRQRLPDAHGICPRCGRSLAAHDSALCEAGG